MLVLWPWGMSPSSIALENATIKLELFMLLSSPLYFLSIDFKLIY
jgi:hypothetical protein